MLFFRKKEDVLRPHKCISSHPLTLPELEAQIKKRVSVISKEFLLGFDAIKNTPKSVTFFGSARTHSLEADYHNAYQLGKKVAQLGYTVVTGGGPGIMEAANKGAHEINGKSLGFTIQLPTEQITNPYLDKSINFQYFFTRKVTLTYSAEVYVYFPGGFGTLDELFEILTLIQTNKIVAVPIILFGSYFWNPLEQFIREFLVDNGKIDETDLKLFTITDSIKEAVEIVKSAPIRNAH